MVHHDYYFSSYHISHQNSQRNSNHNIPKKKCAHNLYINILHIIILFQQ